MTRFCVFIRYMYSHFHIAHGTHQKLRRSPKAQLCPSWVGHSIAEYRILRQINAAAKESTFGAVVLTLKATGWELLLVIVNERLTRVVNGPIQRILKRGPIDDDGDDTSKAQGRAWIERDGHFGMRLW